MLCVYHLILLLGGTANEARETLAAIIFYHGFHVLLSVLGYVKLAHWFPFCYFGKVSLFSHTVFAILSSIPYSSRCEQCINNAETDADATMKHKTKSIKTAIWHLHTLILLYKRYVYIFHTQPPGRQAGPSSLEMRRGINCGRPGTASTHCLNFTDGAGTSGKILRCAWCHLHSSSSRSTGSSSSSSSSSSSREQQQRHRQ